MTAEYRQHHDVSDPLTDMAVALHRVDSRLDQLLRAGLIDAAGWQAGDTFRRDYEAGELGGASGDPGSAGGGSGRCPTQGRLDALGRLSRAQKSLTVPQRVAMDALAVDASWPEAGRRNAIGRDAARALAVVALNRLAKHYGLGGRRAEIRAVAFGGVGD